MRARLLLSAALPFALLAPAAQAVDIEDDLTEPVSTSTADGGAPDDVNIVSGGSITLDDEGPAVTLDSDHSVTNAGTIAIQDVDNAVGVLVQGGNTGEVNNRGVIRINEEYSREDTDDDGDLDGPLASGTGRVGILVEGPDPFAGGIQNSGSIIVEGNDSAAIRVASDATVEGDIRTRGSISVTGADSAGFDIQGQVDGRVEARSITVAGENSSAVVLAQGADAFQTNGSLQSTGFVTTGFSDYYDPDDVPDTYVPFELDDDELLNGGPTVAVGGDLPNGFYVAGLVGSATEDDPEEGEDEVKDIRPDFNENRGLGQITSYGSAPAVLISPDVDPDGSGDLVVGLAVEAVRDTLDDDEDGDVDEILTTFEEEYGVVNRGRLVANGLNTGFDATALVIAGSEDGTRQTIVEGGMLNAGNITTTSYEADGGAIRFGGGADIGRLNNSGVMIVSVNTEDDHVARGILIENGAQLAELINSGTIQVRVRGDDGSGAAIQDESGTLLTVENTGQILAQYIADADDDDGDGLANDTDERTGEMVAIDMSTATGDASVIQRANTTQLTTMIEGDILFGEGDDRLEVYTGTITSGVLAFGNGSDLLLISGQGVSVVGSLTDEDGDLVLQIEQGSLRITNDAPVQITSAEIGADGSLQFAVSGSTASDGRVIASEGIHFESGAGLTPTLRSLLLDDREFVLMAASDIQVDGELDDLLNTETAFLYERGLEQRSVGDEEQLVLTLRRKSAQELGMDANQASLYTPALEALSAQTDINAAFAELETASEFYKAYNQLMPDYSGAAVYLITANVDGATGAVGNRLDVARLASGDERGLWVQEFLYYVNRDSSLPAGAFDGFGFGFAGGYDVPWGPFDAVGLNVTLSTNRTNQIGGFDEPLQAYSAGLGAYAGGSVAGGLTYDLYAGAAYDGFDSERHLIVGDIDRRNEASWDAYHVNASARIGYDIDLGWLQILPLLSLDYLLLVEGGYTETGGGGGFDLTVNDRTSEVVSATGLVRLQHRFERPSSWWAPALTLGVRNETNSIGATEAWFDGFGSPFYLTPDGVPSTGVLVGFSIMGGTGFSAIGFNYDADIRDGFQRHVARVVVRLVF